MKTQDEIDLAIDRLFEETTPLDDIDTHALAEASREIMNSPEFKSGVIKDDFIHHVLEAMKEQGMTQTELAAKWGRSRQYVSKLLKEDKRVNYTIDTMVELMHHLGHRVEVHFPPVEETTVILRCKTTRACQNQPLNKPFRGFSTCNPENIVEFPNNELSLSAS